MAIADYYVRWRGRLTGPLGLEELKEMVAQGRLSKLHDVSADQTEWRRAGTFEELFPPFLAAAKPIPVMTAWDPVQQAPAAVAQTQQPQEDVEQAGEWYYAHNGTVEGPCAASVIAALLAEGRLTTDDYVTPSADPSGWQLIRDVPEFAAAVPVRPIDSETPSQAEASPEIPVAAAVTEQPDHATLAMTALKWGLVGILVPICGLVGLVFALKARTALRLSGDQSQTGLPTAGIVLGIIDILFDFVKFAILLYVLFLFARPLVA